MSNLPPVVIMFLVLCVLIVGEFAAVLILLVLR
jgi:hypothetical protein